MVEELIYKALNNIKELSEVLAKFNKKPAIFYQESPHDLDNGWNDLQYPRANYMIDWQYNAERKSEGSALIDVWCFNNQEISPEYISGLIQTELSELFMTDKDGTYEMVWNRSDYFETPKLKEEKNPRIVGYTIIFDILAFPNQTIVVPSPVWALNSFLDKRDVNVKVIGFEQLGELWRPSNDVPAVYVRLAGNDLERESYAVSWFKATLNIHVIAPDPQARQNTLQKIAHDLSLAGEAITDDGSPFFVKQIKVLSGSDPLRTGQMVVIGEYGVLPKEPNDPILNNAKFNRKEVI